MVHSEDEAVLGLRGGVVAGLIGGLWVELVLLAVAGMSHQSGWQMLKLPGAPLLHERALAPGFDAAAVIIGVVGHFAVASVWGGVFGLLAYGLTRSMTVVFGVLWGFVAWVGMYAVVLPLLGLAAITRANPIWMTIALHVVFGVVVALGFLPFQKERAAPHGALRGPRRGEAAAM